jgi:hypothetical protein
MTDVTDGFVTAIGLALISILCMAAAAAAVVLAVFSLTCSLIELVIAVFRRPR